ncbi:HAD family hydrolase [Candidatus Viridilinea mediisalina]|uniref:Hydrolase n=1 Tax=Candidatus Viridilinea mediisalina TaxID=2024553 RepID=A0A2A6RH30_9CHLR|nr:HAD family hydrolase [Candidatus Viridilinea mediisalina]PDW02196.1 hydrolase [Candidatus Viridilinea mediisalina]
MKLLILWDVDGTLLSTDGIAAEAMRSAMRAVLGPAAPLVRTSYAGKTDWRIIRESLPTVAPEVIAERLHEFAATYTELLMSQRAELGRRSKLFPGVRAALEALHPYGYQAPLTGNIAAVARLKLESVALLEHVDVAAGAYGDDHHERPALVPIAAARAAARYGQPFGGQQIVIIGDTPHDITCGQAHGARTIAVATGPYSRTELAEYHPDVLMDDLSDTAAVVAAVIPNPITDSR